MIGAAEWTGGASWVGPVGGGVAAGAIFLAISEALLALWRRRPEWAALQVVFAGMLARTAWMLFALAIGRERCGEGLGAFVAALMTAYLASQVVEGLRYTKFAESRG